MIHWISFELAVAIHERQLAEHGGGTGVRDEALLRSALARPQQLHSYGEPPPDLAELAAALAMGLAKNHPFLDGNKRTAHVAYRLFLALNGVKLVATSEDKYLQMYGLASGTVSEKEFAEWIRSVSSVDPENSVQDEQGRYAAA